MELQVKKDFDLINQLLRNPLYRIPEHLRGKVMACAEKIIDYGERDVDKLSAMKTVLMADQTNLRVVSMAMPRRINKEVDIQITDKSTEDLKQLVADAVKLLGAASHDGQSAENGGENLGFGQTRETVALIERDGVFEEDRKENDIIPV